MSLKVYMDMDGCLARWNPVPIAETKKLGYFRNRAAEPNLVNLVHLMIMDGIEVNILSAAYQDDHSAADKIWWLQHIGLGNVPAIFVPYGECKFDYIPANKRDNILIDDYSANLRDWEHAGNTGIKFRNQINGTQGTWTGLSINWEMSSSDMLSFLKQALYIHRNS